MRKVTKLPRWVDINKEFPKPKKSVVVLFQNKYLVDVALAGCFKGGFFEAYTAEVLPSTYKPTYWIYSPSRGESV